MLRALLCSAALLGFGTAASADELDKEAVPAKAAKSGITGGPAANAGSELDNESPTPAHRWRGGWGYGGWGGGWGYGYRSYGFGFGVYRPYWGGFGYPGFGYSSFSISVGRFGYPEFGYPGFGYGGFYGGFYRPYYGCYW